MGSRAELRGHAARPRPCGSGESPHATPMRIRACIRAFPPCPPQHPARLDLLEERGRVGVAHDGLLVADLLELRDVLLNDLQLAAGAKRKAVLL